MDERGDSEADEGGMYEDVDPREEMEAEEKMVEDYSGDDNVDQVKDDLEEYSDNEESELYANEDMVREIEEKEKELLGAKKQWQMTGEVLAADRPINSLVDEDLDFQLATKLPLVHTVSCGAIVGGNVAGAGGDYKAKDKRRDI